MIFCKDGKFILTFSSFSIYCKEDIKLLNFDNEFKDFIYSDILFLFFFSSFSKASITLDLYLRYILDTLYFPYLLPIVVIDYIFSYFLTLTLSNRGCWSISVHVGLFLGFILNTLYIKSTTSLLQLELKNILFFSISHYIFVNDSFLNGVL